MWCGWVGEVGCHVQSHRAPVLSRRARWKVVRNLGQEGLRDFHSPWSNPLPGPSPSWSNLGEREKRTGDRSQNSTRALKSLSYLEARKGWGQALNCRVWLEPSFRPFLVLKCMWWAFRTPDFQSLCIFLSLFKNVTSKNIKVFTFHLLTKWSLHTYNIWMHSWGGKPCMQRKPSFIIIQKHTKYDLLVICYRNVIML